MGGWATLAMLLADDSTKLWADASMLLKDAAAACWDDCNNSDTCVKEGRFGSTGSSSNSDIRSVTSLGMDEHSDAFLLRKEKCEEEAVGGATLPALPMR